MPMTLEYIPFHYVKWSRRKIENEKEKKNVNEYEGPPFILRVTLWVLLFQGPPASYSNQSLLPVSSSYGCSPGPSPVPVTEGVQGGNFSAVPAAEVISGLHCPFR